MTHDEILQGLYDDTLSGTSPRCGELTTWAWPRAWSPRRCSSTRSSRRSRRSGARFERGDYFVPEMLIAARAMQGALDILRPLLAETGVQPIGTFVMGTVKGDVHDIGKNLVNIMLEGAGFTVIDLGVNVAPEKFVEQIEEHKPDIVGFSAFLTTTMPMFKANINALEKAGLREKVIVMVGGAPGDAGVRRRGRRRRLRRRRLDGGAPGQGPDREASAGAVTAMEPLVARIETAVKDRVWGCQMCGHCVLHSTGMTCPMNVPEDASQRPLRRRARRRGLRGEARDALRVAQGLRALASRCRCSPSTWRDEFNHLRPPVDNRLNGHVVVDQLRDEARPSNGRPAGGPSERCSCLARVPGGGRLRRHGRDADDRRRRPRRACAPARAACAPASTPSTRPTTRPRTRTPRRRGRHRPAARRASSRSCSSSAATRTGSRSRPTSSAPRCTASRTSAA